MEKEAILQPFSTLYPASKHHCPISVKLHSAEHRPLLGEVSIWLHKSCHVNAINFNDTGPSVQFVGLAISWWFCLMQVEHRCSNFFLLCLIRNTYTIIVLASLLPRRKCTAKQWDACQGAELIKLCSVTFGRWTASYTVILTTRATALMKARGSQKAALLQ